MRNYWNAFLENTTRISGICNLQSLLVEVENKCGAAICLLDRIMLNESLHTHAPFTIATTTHTNFINIAVIVNCTCEKLSNNDAAAQQSADNNQNWQPTPFAFLRLSTRLCGCAWR